MAKTTPDHSLGPEDNTCSLSAEPIFMEEVTCALTNFDGIMSPCAHRIMLHQETLSQILL